MLGMQRFDLCWPCTFHVVCVPFSALGTRKLPNINTVSGGIQAFYFTTNVPHIHYTVGSTQNKQLFVPLHQRDEYIYVFVPLADNPAATRRVATLMLPRCTLQPQVLVPPHPNTLQVRWRLCLEIATGAHPHRAHEHGALSAGRRTPMHGQEIVLETFRKINILKHQSGEIK